MRWLLACGTLLAVALGLFAVPARLEGPVLVPISPGHGLALLDVMALVALLGDRRCCSAACGDAASGWTRR